MSEGTWEKLSQIAVKGAEHDSRERQPHPKCLEGTRVVLLNRISELFNKKKSHLIWLHGAAGVGKSAVAFTVAERMRGLKVTEETNVEKRLAGTFFFSRKHTKRRTTGYFFATLAYQLAINFPSVKTHVKQAILENPALLDSDKSLRDQMEALFLRPLRKLQSRLRECPPLTFVIDALDECTPEPANEPTSEPLDESTSESELADLISLLGEAIRDPDIPVTHILLTSRSEEHIRKAMQTKEMRPLVCEIPVKTSGEGVAATISLDGADVDNDIYIFLQHSFRDLESRHPDFPQPSNDQLARLASRAGRRFIVASTMVKFIDDRNHDPRNRLQLMLELTSELLPGTEVYRLYDSILSTCADPSLAYLHLSVVAALADPLLMSQISKLLGPSHGRDIETILLQLRSIIEIPTDSNLPVNIYHSSVRDYVSHRPNCNLHQVQYVISPHSLLALSSLQLMMYDISGSTTLLDALSELNRQSQALDPHNPRDLKHSLSFMVQPPEPMQVLITLLWLRGNRSSELQFWLETLDGRAWLQTQRGEDWLVTQGGKDWLEKQGGQDWLLTQGRKGWLETAGGRVWLETPGGRVWLRSPGGQDWLQSPGGKDWLETVSVLDWLETPGGQVWLQTLGGRDWLETQDGRDWLLTRDGRDWLLTQDGRDWVLTEDGKTWLQSLDGRAWLQSLGGRAWLLTRGGGGWLMTRGATWLLTQGGRAWLLTQGGRVWLQAEGGRIWLWTEGGRKWLRTECGRDWMQTDGGQRWLRTDGGQDWLQTDGGREWLQFPKQEHWLQTLDAPRLSSLLPPPPQYSPPSPQQYSPPSPQQYSPPSPRPQPSSPPALTRADLVQTWNESWLQIHGMTDLQTPDGEGWLQTQTGRYWLQTQAGQHWLQTPGGREWLEMRSEGSWLPTPPGRRWLQTQSGEDWLQTQGGREWLQTQGGEVWLQTQGGNDWLQTQHAREWLQTQDGRQWLQSPSMREWLQTSGGREWLQTQDIRDWLQTQGGRQWLQSTSVRDWLQTSGGRDWLQTQYGRSWLQTYGGRKWLQTQGGQDWLQTQCGRDWLQTPHGQAWRLTTMWVTMEEFLNTLEAVREYTIIPELRLQPVFRVIQQFNDLPDFLIFPAFLALRHQDQSTATLSQGSLPPDMGIIHVMKDFSSLAYEARERSRSTSDILNYACQNWAVHLSRAPNPWDERLAHIFKTFWNRYSLSWLERQWCLKDLQSCLTILTIGQKLAQEHLLQAPGSSH